MKEAVLRKYHRHAGAVIALFVVLQAGSGLLLSLERLTGWKPFGTPAGFVHTVDGDFGDLYRILIGSGLLFMATTGGWIFAIIHARTRPTVKNQ